MSNNHYVVYVRPDGNLGKRAFPTKSKAGNFAIGHQLGSALIFEVRDGKLRTVDQVPSAEPRDDP
jgi:hypothetical protein